MSHPSTKTADLPVPSEPLPPRFKPIRSPRAFEEIATQIRAELSQGRLIVGSRLPSERALAEQFGVSRNTLREALRSLERSGLISLQKGATGGAFISNHSADALITSIHDLYHLGTISPAQLTEARIWLESVIVLAACERATSTDLRELTENIDAAEVATRAGDFESRKQLHFHFHRILARITGNPVMMIVMEGVLSVLRTMVDAIGEYPNEFVLPSRRRFMKHFSSKNGPAAAAEMESSLKRLQKAYLSAGPQRK